MNNIVSLKQLAFILVSIMFVWSGFGKISSFNSNVTGLTKKTGLPSALCSIGMFLVVILEIVGFIVLLEYFLNIKGVSGLFSSILSQKQLSKYILVCVLLFLVVVTLIYHPFSFSSPYPFLKNLSLFGAFLYIYADRFA